MPLEAQPLEPVRTADLNDLLHRRDELAFKLGRQRMRLHGLLSDLRHLDAEILRAGGTKPEAVPINELFTRRLGGEDGELTRLLAEIFEASPAGLTSRTIAIRLMETLALDTADRKAVRYVTSRVCVALWVLRQKGQVRTLDTSRTPQLWQWIDAA